MCFDGEPIGSPFSFKYRDFHMASISIMHIAWKNVLRKIFRNLVLVLAVSLLVALLVFALLFNQAVQDDINEASRRLGADIVLVPAEAQSSAEEFILESHEKTFYMDEFIVEAISGLDEIEAVNSHIYLKTLDSGCCSIDEGQVIAIDSSNDFVIKPWIEDGPPTLGENEVYVGNYVYEFLGLIDTASLFGQGVKIVGHLELTGTGIDRGIFVRKEDIFKVSDQALEGYKQGNISIVFIKLKEGADVTEVVGKIRNINPRIGIMTRGSIGADIRETLKDILSVFTITIFISSVLAILLAWSTFTALANERRREVGILRAIGARQIQVVSMFLMEALFISAIGGLLGIFLGHYLIYWLASDFHLLSRLGAESTMSINSIVLSGLSVLVGITVCLVGALMPVLHLSRMEPLLAIKEE